MERLPHPFFPFGCPFQIHSPFTSRSQAQLVTGDVGTGQVFKELLSDFAFRRGWQPLVCVQPQPDTLAVHLAPASADPTLVSVLLRSGREVQARCVSCMMPPPHYHSITVNGRYGRRRLPYQVRRTIQQPVPVYGMGTAYMQTWAHLARLRRSLSDQKVGEQASP